jgi:hypothetical protein
MNSAERFSFCYLEGKCIAKYILGVVVVGKPEHVELLIRFCAPDYQLLLLFFHCMLAFPGRFSFFIMVIFEREYRFNNGKWTELRTLTTEELREKYPRRKAWRVCFWSTSVIAISLIIVGLSSNLSKGGFSLLFSAALADMAVYSIAIRRLEESEPGREYHIDCDPNEIPEALRVPIEGYVKEARLVVDGTPPITNGRVRL